MKYALLFFAIWLGASGCNREPTQVVVGVVTNLAAPDALDSVQMTVLRQGVEVLRHEWTVPGQAAQPYELPGSFVIFSPSGADAQVEVTVRGLNRDKEVLQRRSVFSLVREQTLFVRMALVQRCEATTCGAGQTCVEGRCKAVEFSSRRFPRYQAGMERAAMCQSGTVFRHTVTRAALPLWGSGVCAANEECIEATCYLREEDDGGTAGADMNVVDDDMSVAGVDMGVMPGVDMGVMPGVDMGVMPGFDLGTISLDLGVGVFDGSMGRDMRPDGGPPPLDFGGTIKDGFVVK